MISPEERREVAEQLRRLVRLHDAVECGSVARVLGLEYEVHGCVVAFGRQDVAALADLIDPTCHVVPFDEESMRLPHCSSCGHPILKPWPNYCPNYGRRVMRDGD